MAGTLEQINAILYSPDFDESDKAVVKWQYSRALEKAGHAPFYGGFMMALWEAISRADENNLDRLARGFPIEIEGYRRWSRGDLGDRIRAAGLDI